LGTEIVKQFFSKAINNDNKHYKEDKHMKTNKLLAVLLTLVMLVGLLPAA
jgi:hypothetical protein